MANAWKRGHWVNTGLGCKHTRWQLHSLFVSSTHIHVYYASLLLCTTMHFHGKPKSWKASIKICHVSPVYERQSAAKEMDSCHTQRRRETFRDNASYNYLLKALHGRLFGMDRFCKEKTSIKIKFCSKFIPVEWLGKTATNSKTTSAKTQLSTSAPLTCTLSTLTPSSGSSNEENIECLDSTDTTVNSDKCPQEQAEQRANFARLQAKLDELQKQNESLQKQNAILSANSLLLNERISVLKKKTFCLENFIVTSNVK